MKMNIKEAGRYSNYFNGLLGSLNYIHPDIAGNLYKTTEKHKRNESIEGVDEITKELKIDSTYDVTPEQVSELIATLLSEKLKLSSAIAQAKAIMIMTIDGVDYPYDTAIEYAKLLQTMSKGFYRNIDNYKPSTADRRGSDYTFNVEGNQVPYTYPLEVVTELKFEKSTFKKEDKDLKTLANKLSTEIEEMSSRKVIDFETDFDYLEKIDEVMQKLVVSQ